MTPEDKQVTLNNFAKEERKKLEETVIEASHKLPEGWKWIRLNGIAKIVMGQSPPSDTYNDEGEGLPFYQGKADFGIIHPKPRKWCNKPSKIALENDILISIRAPVGPVNICKEKSCIGRGLAAIRVGKDADYKFLFFNLRSREAELTELGKGSTFGAIKKKDLEHLKVPLPPLDVQRRVVARIEELMSRIEQAKKLREEALKDTEAIMQSTLHQTFSKAEEEYGLRTLSEVCEINPSKKEIRDLPGDMKVTFVPMSAVSEIAGRIENPSIKLLKEVKKGYTYFREGDVLFAKITPCMENGKSAIAQNLVNGVGFGSTEFHVIRPSKEIIAEWIYYFIRQKSFRELAARNMIGSVGQQRVPNEFLESARIPVPPTPDQRRFVGYIDKIKARVVALKEYQEETAEKIEAMTRIVLRKAFNGEL